MKFVISKSWLTYPKIRGNLSAHVSSVIKSVILLTFIFCSNIVTGQVSRLLSSIDEYEVGVVVGIVGMRGIRFPEYNKPKVGYNAFAGARVYVSQRSALNFKAGWEQKGALRRHQTTYYDTDGNGRQGTRDFTINLNYINVLGGYSIAYRLFNVETGAHAAYLIKAQIIDVFSWAPRDVYNAIDFFKRYDYGINVRPSIGVIGSKPSDVKGGYGPYFS